MGTWRLAGDMDWNGLPYSSWGGGQGVRASVEGEPLHPHTRHHTCEGTQRPRSQQTLLQRTTGERDFCTRCLDPVLSFTSTLSSTSAVICL